jgi:hypothetical protein
MAETSDSVQQLFMRLSTDGVSVPELTDWSSKPLSAILLATESGAWYVIEPIYEQPSLVTRFSEATPFYGEFKLPSPEMILRKPGNPDQNLEVGKPVDIYGLPRRGTEFDPDSLYTTTPLTGIQYLENEP